MYAISQKKSEKYPSVQKTENKNIGTKKGQNMLRIYPHYMGLGSSNHHLGCLAIILFLFFKQQESIFPVFFQILGINSWSFSKWETGEIFHITSPLNEYFFPIVFSERRRIFPIIFVVFSFISPVYYLCKKAI